MNIINNEFNTFLRELRKAKGLTIVGLASKSGLSRSYISQLERGERGKDGVPSPDVLKKFSKALDVSYQTLMMKAGYLQEDSEELLKKYKQKVALLEETRKEITLAYQHLEYLNNAFSALNTTIPQSAYEKEERSKRILRKLNEIDHAEQMINSKVQLCNKLSSELKDLVQITDATIDYEEAQIKNLLEAFDGPTSGVLELENLFNMAQEIHLHGRKLTDQEKEKALQILKLTFDTDTNKTD